MDFNGAEILGLVAGFLTALSNVPQTWKIIKTKQAEAVSATTYFILSSSYALWLIYGVMEGAVSIIFWNAVAFLLAVTVLTLKKFVWKS